MLDFAQDLGFLALWTLALARATRLLTTDEITDFIRIAVYNRWGGPQSKAGYFITCPWCLSVWLGAATAWMVFLATGWSWWLYPLVALAASYLVGLSASNLEPEDDSDIEIIGN